MSKPVEISKVNDMRSV